MVNWPINRLIWFMLWQAKNPDESVLWREDGYVPILYLDGSATAVRLSRVSTHDMMVSYIVICDEAKSRSRECSEWESDSHWIWLHWESTEYKDTLGTVAERRAETFQNLRRSFSAKPKICDGICSWNFWSVAAIIYTKGIIWILVSEFLSPCSPDTLRSSVRFRLDGDIYYSNFFQLLLSKRSSTFFSKRVFLNGFFS